MEKNRSNLTPLICLLISLLMPFVSSAKAECLLNTLPGITLFLVQYNEFGLPICSRAIPDWDHGERQRVEFKNGKSLLFYLHEGKVITVYEDIKGNERYKVWGEEFKVEHETNIDRSSNAEIPKYTIVSIVNQLDGNKQADIIIPSISQNTPHEIRKRIALAIQKNENLKTLSLYSTEDAYKSAYSASYAKKHPEAHKGNLGAISWDTGKFEDYIHITDDYFEKIFLKKQ